MGERFPGVAAALDDGRWTKAAERELLRLAGRPETPGTGEAPETRGTEEAPEPPATPEPPA
jgi:hypothetical protein